MKKFKFGDKVKIIFTEEAKDDLSRDLLMFDNHIGTYISEVHTNYESLLIKINKDYVPLPKEFIKSPDEKEDDTTQTQRFGNKRNFVTKLENDLCLQDGEVFVIDKDDIICYFADGQFFVIDDNNHEVNDDYNLRNEIFYGLADGSIKRKSKQKEYPLFGSKYFYWRTSHFVPETFSIETNTWRGKLEDYFNFYFGNCFTSEEDCEKNSKVIEVIKNKTFLKQYEVKNI